jgi:hypothetical protein
MVVVGFPIDSAVMGCGIEMIVPSELKRWRP